MENIKHSILPGFLWAVAIAFVAKAIESILPMPLISASVIALFIGIFFNRYRKTGDIFNKGIQFTSKKILRLAIIFLGASLNITTILNIGQLSISVMIFTLLTCFGGGYFIGKILGLNWKLSNLISAGTGICGGSAIAAIAPVIEARDIDVAYSMSATFIFDMVMIIVFPIMGRMMGLSDVAYGLWAGTAVNDTSSVVAAGYAFSEAAGDFATMVKLTRTLVIIPTVITFALINMRIKSKEKSNYDTEQEILDGHMKSVIPWFILGFLGFSAINSLGLIPIGLSITLKEVSKFLMVCALAAIGLNTSKKDMESAGITPMLHGFIVSLLVVIVSIAVIYFMGLI